MYVFRVVFWRSITELCTDKAAQAAAQAAQAAALQVQYEPPVQAPPQNAPQLTPEQALQLLEKFGITQFLNSGSQIPTANLEALQAAVQRNEQQQQQPGAQSQQQSMGPYDVFGPSSFEAGSSFGSSFSPFSPDPNYLGETLSRDNSVSVSPGQSQSFSSTSSKGYAPWYSSQDDKVGSGSSGKASPTGPAASSRPSSARPFASFLGDAPNRASSRQEGPVARPDVPRRPSQGMEHFILPGQDRDHDPIHDLNGTLASLNLDNQGSWKSAHESSLQASS